MRVAPSGPPAPRDAFERNAAGGLALFDDADGDGALDASERARIAVGATCADVVRTRMFVADIERDWQVVDRAHADAFGGVRPATTRVEVRRLIEPWMLVEIGADAFVAGEE